MDPQSRIIRDYDVENDACVSLIKKTRLLASGMSSRFLDRATAGDA